MAVNMQHGSATLVVSIHDVAPATAEQTRQWCEDVDSFGIPTSLLVIPGPWRGGSLADAPDYAGVLKERVAHGDELVLHGWVHTAGPEGSPLRRAVCHAVARGAAEFGALDEAQATQRLAAGQAVLNELGLTVDGFTPPGWLASRAANRALHAAGFRYTTSHFGVHDLGTGRMRRGFALSHRPGGGWTERLGARMVERGARRTAARRGGLVRIALHPDDRGRPGLRDATMRAIETVLAAGGHATTYSGAMPDVTGAP
jgi:predicted deacetylase